MEEERRKDQKEEEKEKDFSDREWTEDKTSHQDEAGMGIQVRNDKRGESYKRT